MSEHRLIVDRYEDQHAVVEADDAGFFDLPRFMLPRATVPDDVLAVTVSVEGDRSVVTLTHDREATNRAREAGRAAVERLKRRDPGGDVTL